MTQLLFVIMLQNLDLPRLPISWSPQDGSELTQCPPSILEIGLRDSLTSLQPPLPERNRALLFLYKHNSRIASTLGFVSITTYGASVFLTDVYWRTIAAVLGMTNMAIGMFFKQQVQTPEEIVELEAMSRCSYVALRCKQVFDPIHHKRQTMAFGHILTGIPMGIAGIITGRHSETVSMLNLAACGLIFGLPITDAGGWFAISFYSCLTYGGVIATYGAVLASKEGDWASVIGDIFGIASVVLPLTINGLMKRHEINEAKGFEKVKTLFR